MRLRSALALWAFVAALVLVASTSVVQAAAVKSVDVLRYTAPDGETYFALPLVAPASRLWPFSMMSSRHWAVRTAFSCLPLTCRRPL